MKPEQFSDRFWRRVLTGAQDECWPYQGYVNPHTGYGMLRMSNPRRMGMAHRIAWELAHGSLPKGAWVLHKCDNRMCCNPQHLFIGDHQTNMEDARAKGRFAGRNNKLAYSDVLQIRAAAAEGSTQRVIARKFATTQQNVSWIVAEKTWRSAPGVYSKQPVKWVRCRYCGARLRRDHIGHYCPTKNCQWQHGLPKEEEDTLRPERADMKWITPDQNDGRTIFVFGSNLAGLHGAGAAKEAAHSWGAERGVGNGRQGQSYAIPTKDYRLHVLPLEQIRKFVGQFKGYARQHPELRFLVTEIGCGLAGYVPEEIAPMFEGFPTNCVLPNDFTEILDEGP